jgi:hypothetical protein
MSAKTSRGERPQHAMACMPSLLDVGGAVQLGLHPGIFRHRRRALDAAWSQAHADRQSVEKGQERYELLAPTFMVRLQQASTIFLMLLRR